MIPTQQLKEYQVDDFIRACLEKKVSFWSSENSKGVFFNDSSSVPNFISLENITVALRNRLDARKKEVAQIEQQVQDVTEVFNFILREALIEDLNSEIDASPAEPVKQVEIEVEDEKLIEFGTLPALNIPVASEEMYNLTDYKKVETWLFKESKETLSGLTNFFMFLLLSQDEEFYNSQFCTTGPYSKPMNNWSSFDKPKVYRQAVSHGLLALTATDGSKKIYVVTQKGKKQLAEYIKMKLENPDSDIDIFTLRPQKLFGNNQRFAHSILGPGKMDLVQSIECSVADFIRLSEKKKKTLVQIVLLSKIRRFTAGAVVRMSPHSFSYFDFKIEVLNQLVKDEFIRTYKLEGNQFYKVTDLGVKQLELLIDSNQDFLKTLSKQDSKVTS